MRVALAAALVCTACSSSTTVITGTGGGAASGSAGGTTGTAGGSGGAGGDPSGCSDDAKTVYVLALDRTFSAFDPRTKTFRDIGQLACPASGGAGPFSMSIARDAFAYVLYDNGELFKVSTMDLSCTQTSFATDATYRVFGMGFSTDVGGGTTDTLFIAGGQSVVPMSKLGRLDVSSFAPTPLVDLTGWPELTGTGDAKLWGFFPDGPMGGSTPFVARIDKVSGALSSSFPAPSLAGIPNSWAFAFWGGSFWIFLRRAAEASTSIWEMKASDGTLSAGLMDTGRTIVGAGVSTCAPLTIN